MLLTKYSKSFKALLLIFIMMSFHQISAQINIEGQLGGNAAIGATINGGYQLNIGKNHFLTPSIGYGYIFTGYWVFTSGINYNIKKFGVGCYVSGTKDEISNDGFNEVYVFPNFNYITNLESGRYWKFALGYMIFPDYRFGIPWIGISVGFKDRNE